MICQDIKQSIKSGFFLKEPNVGTIRKYKITMINRLKSLVEMVDNIYEHMKNFSREMVQDGYVGRS